MVNIWIINLIRINGEIETHAVREKAHAEAVFQQCAQTLFGADYEQLIAERKLGRDFDHNALYLSNNGAAISLKAVPVE